MEGPTSTGHVALASFLSCDQVREMAGRQPTQVMSLWLASPLQYHSRHFSLNGRPAAMCGLLTPQNFAG